MRFYTFSIPSSRTFVILYSLVKNTNFYIFSVSGEGEELPASLCMQASLMSTVKYSNSDFFVQCSDALWCNFTIIQNYLLPVFRKIPKWYKTSYSEDNNNNNNKGTQPTLRLWGAEQCRQNVLFQGYDTTRAPLLEASLSYGKPRSTQIWKKKKEWKNGKYETTPKRKLSDMI